ncbi:glutaminyl-peptide cyclotransferase [Amycolatopsis suaedae]|uniref:Glutaminyl-peptide cyclotransferase n=1 Tax=Amycolatopsis suaedae TaxID=2510978 RepID=A0A4Q7J4A3_9PSEU|nr:glutaminyl-peptide cyclotransferase [Amycolatopsis suaedae]RZQ61827.1 glutaminyl-peptide cyclotransferase [Amycolatopsis suaedae]
MRTPLLLAMLLAATLTSCAADEGEPSGPEQLKLQVLEVLPHDPAAFTQGLELAGDTLYEGTGLPGRSQLRAGPVAGPPQRAVTLPAPLFGEGITLVGPSVWQLTWQDGFAIERDAATLAEKRRVPYPGEGWGLCHQPGRGRLVMSDGTDRLTFRDPVTFAEVGAVTAPLDKLNELECVGDDVYANVWQTDRILRLDANGQLTAEIDASGLLTAQEKAEADVLNGIAAVPGTDQFLVTGKLWPKMFRVKLVPVQP